MVRKLTALICLAAVLLCAAGCSEKEETTTLTGMVVSVEGTVVNIKTGSTLTFTLNDKGVATEVLVTSSGMGSFGGNWSGNFGGNFGGNWGGRGQGNGQSNDQAA